MLYGPGAKRNILKMLRAIKKGIPLLLPEFHNKRSMIDVRDVVKAAVLTAKKNESRKQIYIISDGKYYSTRQIINAIRQALGKKQYSFSIPASFFTLSGKIGDLICKICGRRLFFDSDTLNKLSGSAWFSSEKNEQELGFKPDYDLEKALTEMIKEEGG